MSRMLIPIVHSHTENAETQRKAPACWTNILMANYCEEEKNVNFPVTILQMCRIICFRISVLL